MKKIIILLLCCGVLIGTVGCGGNAAPPPTESPLTTVSETAITKTPTETALPVTAVKPTEEEKESTHPTKETAPSTTPQLTESETTKDDPPKEEPKSETKPQKVIDPKPTEKPTPFDIEHWIAYARSYAESKGLLLSDKAVDCWDNPIPAGHHCKNIEQNITDRLNRYKNFEGFTDVWIWSVETGANTYDIYIGYA